jgi:biotin transport system substrate-specific component
MHTQNMVRAALFAALMAICAWISIPVGSMVFTLQTFGIFLALLTLGGKWGLVSVFLYLLLGLAGLPVFSGFRGGVGTLFGPTGGYLPGFLVCGILYRFVTGAKGSRLFGLCVGLLGCYGVCCGWTCLFYGEMGLRTVFTLYVLPYLAPDGIKMAAAFFLARKLNRIFKNTSA